MFHSIFSGLTPEIRLLIKLLARLLPPEFGETVQAQLDRMQPRHLDDFENLWRGMLLELNEEDAFWSWAMKKRLSNNDDRFEAYAVSFAVPKATSTKDSHKN